ncbi:MAG: DISARM system phospholipase D-like protein DrmC [Myxococcota bacterium]
MPRRAADIEGPLARVSTNDLESLGIALREGRVSPPVTASRLAAAGLAVDREGLAAACARLDASALPHVIEAALAERRRQQPGVELVWTGPEATHATTRDTRRVLEQVFRGARRRVVLAGFNFDHGEALFAPLHAAMAERGVTCDFFIDIPGDQRDVEPTDEEPVVSTHVREFLEKNWPWDLRPTFHYDPRRFDRDVYASVHAKCIVVDDERAFVTSANFTDRGQTRNIEVGVLVDDPHFATNLSGQFKRCITAGVFRPVPQGWLPPVTEVPSE